MKIALLFVTLVLTGTSPAIAQDAAQPEDPIMPPGTFNHYCAPT